MNKKFGIIMVFVLLAGAVFLSACQEEVGRRILNNAKDGGSGDTASVGSSKFITIGNTRIPKDSVKLITEKDKITPYEAYCQGEIDRFRIENDIPNDWTIIRYSTEGLLIPGEIEAINPNDIKIKTLVAVGKCVYISIGDHSYHIEKDVIIPTDSST